VLVLLSTSLNALFFGVMGEYVGRIYKQVKRGPLTVVEYAINTTPVNVPTSPAQVLPADETNRAA
jgi:hypothetical protein